VAHVASLAQPMSSASFSGVANRHSSTTLSMPSTPVSSATVIPGSSWSAAAALIHRSAFHHDMP
jgi:hypothetical protein